MDQGRGKKEVEERSVKLLIKQGNQRGTGVMHLHLSVRLRVLGLTERERKWFDHRRMKKEARDCMRKPPSLCVGSPAAGAGTATAEPLLTCCSCSRQRIPGDD